MSENEKEDLPQPLLPSAPEERPGGPVPRALNKALGARFEDRIAESLLFYERSGEAAVEKTPEPMHPTKNLGAGNLSPTTRSPRSLTTRALSGAAER